MSGRLASLSYARVHPVILTDCNGSCVCSQFRHNVAPREGGTLMAISIEDLRNFQSRELEQPNLQTNGRQPVFTKTIEWSLIEIVIILTELREGLIAAANTR